MAGIDNIFEFLTSQGENAGKGFEEEGILRPFSTPAGDAEDFLEESLILMCDREDLEEKYERAGDSEDKIVNMHESMMVPAIKNDYIAGHHRDLYLRHASSRIKRFIGEAARRKNQAENVHKPRKETFSLYESLAQKGMT